jgi:hypothetical protein
MCNFQEQYDERKILDTRYLKVFFILVRMHPASIILTNFMEHGYSWKVPRQANFLLYSYGNQKFITVFTKHWILPKVTWIQIIPSCPNSLMSSLILSSHLCLGLPNDVFPWHFMTKILYELLIFPVSTTHTIP